MIICSLAGIADLIVRCGDFESFIKRIRLRLNNAHFLDSLSWKSAFIKFTIRQRIKPSISSFCCLEMFSEFKLISTAFSLIDVHQNATLSESFEGVRSRVIGNRCKVRKNEFSESQAISEICRM